MDKFCSLGGIIKSNLNARVNRLTSSSATIEFEHESEYVAELRDCSTLKLTDRVRTIKLKESTEIKELKPNTTYSLKIKSAKRFSIYSENLQFTTLSKRLEGLVRDAMKYVLTYEYGNVKRVLTIVNEQEAISAYHCFPTPDLEEELTFTASDGTKIQGQVKWYSRPFDIIVFKLKTAVKVSPLKFDSDSKLIDSKLIRPKLIGSEYFTIGAPKSAIPLKSTIPLEKGKTVQELSITYGAISSQNIDFLCKMDGRDYFMYRGSTACSEGYSGGPVFSIKNPDTLFGIVKCGLVCEGYKKYTGIIPSYLIHFSLNQSPMTGGSESNNGDYCLGDDTQDNDYYVDYTCKCAPTTDFLE